MGVLFQLSQDIMLFFWQLEVKCLEEEAPCSDCCKCVMWARGGLRVEG